MKAWCDFSSVCIRPMKDPASHESEKTIANKQKSSEENWFSAPPPWKQRSSLTFLRQDKCPVSRPHLPHGTSSPPLVPPQQACRMNNKWLHALCFGDLWLQTAAPRVCSIFNYQRHQTSVQPWPSQTEAISPLRLSAKQITAWQASKNVLLFRRIY